MFGGGSLLVYELLICFWHSTLYHPLWGGGPVMQDFIKWLEIGVDIPIPGQVKLNYCHIESEISELISYFISFSLNVSKCGSRNAR